MKSIDTFKIFMAGPESPNYVSRYCEHFNDIEWIRFYAQMIEATLLTDEPDYLFYVLKWILKNDFNDLAYEMYCIDMNDPEMRPESLIKDSLWDAYSSHYFSQYKKDFGLPD